VHVSLEVLEVLEALDALGQRGVSSGQSAAEEAVDLVDGEQMEHVAAGRDAQVVVGQQAQLTRDASQRRSQRHRPARQPRRPCVGRQLPAARQRRHAQARDSSDRTGGEQSAPHAQPPIAAGDATRAVMEHHAGTADRAYHRGIVMGDMGDLMSDDRLELGLVEQRQQPRSEVQARRPAREPAHLRVRLLLALDDDLRLGQTGQQAQSLDDPVQTRASVALIGRASALR
jgi:hypothetical protein